jgi:hypothetical protein
MCVVGKKPCHFTVPNSNCGSVANDFSKIMYSERAPFENLAQKDIYISLEAPCDGIMDFNVI